MTDEENKDYVPALKFNWLTSLYAEVLPLVPQYKAFHKQLIKEALIDSEQKFWISDLGRVIYSDG